MNERWNVAVECTLLKIKRSWTFCNISNRPTTINDTFFSTKKGWLLCFRRLSPQPSLVVVVPLCKKNRVIINSISGLIPFIFWCRSTERTIWLKKKDHSLYSQVAKSLFETWPSSEVMFKILMLPYLNNNQRQCWHCTAVVVKKRNAVCLQLSLISKYTSLYR